MVNKAVLVLIWALVIAPEAAVSQVPEPLTSVTTLAGIGTGFRDGTGSEARFWSLTSSVLVGNQLYATDQGNNRICQIDVNKGSVTTLVSGNAVEYRLVDGKFGKVTFTQLSGITYLAGCLYVIDNRTVRRVDLTAKTVKTIGRVMGDSLDPSQIEAGKGVLYVADGNGCVSQMDPGTGKSVLLAGSEHPDRETNRYVDGAAAEARFNWISDLRMVGDRLMVADKGNKCVRAIDLKTRMVSTAADGFYYPESLAGEENQLVIADFKTLISWEGQTRNPWVLSPEDALSSPGAWSIADLAINGTTLFVVCRDVVYSVKKSTGQVEVLAGAQSAGRRNGAALQATFLDANAAAALGDQVYITDGYDRGLSGGQIRRLDLSKNEVTLVKESGRDLYNPRALVTWDGSLYFLDNPGDSRKPTQLKKFVVSRQELTSVATLPLVEDDPSWPDPWRRQDAQYLAVKDGQAYVSDSRTPQVWNIDLATGVVKVLVGAQDPVALVEPRGLVVLGKQLYIADSGLSTLLRVSLPQSRPEAVAKIEHAKDLTTDGAKLFVSTGRQVLEVDPDSGSVLLLAGQTGTLGDSLPVTDGPRNKAVFQYFGGLTWVNNRLIGIEKYEHTIRAVSFGNKSE